MIDKPAVELSRLTVARVAMLDLLKSCGIQPTGTMSWDDDCEAVRRYVDGLRDLATHLQSELDRLRYHGTAMRGEILSACSADGEAADPLEEVRKVVAERDHLRTMATVEPGHELREAATRLLDWYSTEDRETPHAWQTHDALQRWAALKRALDR